MSIEGKIVFQPSIDAGPISQALWDIKTTVAESAVMEL
jgi:hypothetical protein